MHDPANVSSALDFQTFLEDLAKDAKGNLNTWENRDLPSFLEALAAYAHDISGYYLNQGINVRPDVASFRLFADLLMGARIYE